MKKLLFLTLLYLCVALVTTSDSSAAQPNKMESTPCMKNSGHCDVHDFVSAEASVLESNGKEIVITCGPYNDYEKVENPIQDCTRLVAAAVVLVNSRLSHKLQPIDSEQIIYAETEGGCVSYSLLGGGESGYCFKRVQAKLVLSWR